MKEVIILFAMIFCHIADDFYLQGIMKEMKQKTWWRERTDKELYEYDYIIVLFLHAFSWTCMIHVPVILPMVISGVYCGGHWFFITFMINWAIHAIVDDEKANKLSINLVADQTIHIAQVVLTWVVYMMFL